MSIRAKHLLLGLTALTLLACSETFKPASYVDRLRILAIRAEVPEVEPLSRDEDGQPLSAQREDHPGDRSRIRSLVADPAQLQEPERVVTVLYLSCTPEPRSPGSAAACTSYVALQDPAALVGLIGLGQGQSCGEGTRAGPSSQQGWIEFLGAERCSGAGPCEPATVDLGGIPVEIAPSYVIPEELSLETLPSEDPARILGVQASVVAIAIAATVDELLQGVDPGDPCSFGPALSTRFAALLEEREHVSAVKRVPIRGPDSPDDPNRNPEVLGILAGKHLLPETIEDPPQQEAELLVGKAYGLRAIPPSGGPDFQRFSRFDAYGKKLKTEREEWLYSWFATAGSLDALRTRAADEANRWRISDDPKEEPFPPDGRAFVYVVVRDLRGGIDWAIREVRLAKP